MYRCNVCIQTIPGDYALDVSGAAAGDDGGPPRDLFLECGALKSLRAIVRALSPVVHTYRIVITFV